MQHLASFAIDKLSCSTFFRWLPHALLVPTIRELSLENRSVFEAIEDVITDKRRIGGEHYQQNMVPVGDQYAGYSHVECSQRVSWPGFINRETGVRGFLNTSRIITEHFARSGSTFLVGVDATELPLKLRLSLTDDQ
jgi:hypothetical protein